MSGHFFTWDETKRLKTLEKHRLDFIDVIAIFNELHLVIPARSDTEERFAAIGLWNSITVTVFFTIRGQTIRIITARRARQNERDLYQALHDRRNSPDERPH